MEEAHFVGQQAFVAKQLGQRNTAQAMPHVVKIERRLSKWRPEKSIVDVMFAVFPMIGMPMMMAQRNHFDRISVDEVVDVVNFLLSSTQPLVILSVVFDGEDSDCVADDAVVHAVRKPFDGASSFVAMLHRKSERIVANRKDACLDLVDESFAKSFISLFVEPSSFNQIVISDGVLLASELPQPVLALTHRFIVLDRFDFTSR